MKSRHIPMRKSMISLLNRDAESRRQGNERVEKFTNAVTNAVSVEMANTQPSKGERLDNAANEVVRRLVVDMQITDADTFVSLVSEGVGRAMALGKINRSAKGELFDRLFAPAGDSRRPLELSLVEGDIRKVFLERTADDLAVEIYDLDPTMDEAVNAVANRVIDDKQITDDYEVVKVAT